MTTLEPDYPTDDLVAAREQIYEQQLAGIAEQKVILAASPELRDVLRDVGAIRGVAVDTDYEDFDGLQASMRSVFDFRTKADGTYGERWDAEENPELKAFLAKCDSELQTRIYSVAEAFKLTGDTEPENPEKIAGVILGAGGRAPLDRTRYAKELLDSAQLNPEYLAMPSSGRKITDTDIRNGGDYVGSAKTEFDLMVNALTEVFGVVVNEQDILSWQDQSIGYDTENTVKVAYIPATKAYPPIFIISAPMTDDRYIKTLINGVPKETLRTRANSRESLRALGRMAQFKPGDEVVAVTNAHFRPFQGAAAAGELAKYGAMTEVVGFDPSHFGNTPKRPDELLQEMLTTADSLAKAGAIRPK